MVIIETSIFTRQVLQLLDDDEYRQLQIALVRKPDLGALITGTGGLRKARWKTKQRGKRGGVRVIYYWRVNDDQILMLDMYAKTARDDLTAQQKKLLKQLVIK